MEFNEFMAEFEKLLVQYRDCALQRTSEEEKENFAAYIASTVRVGLEGEKTI